MNTTAPPADRTTSARWFSLPTRLSASYLTVTGVKEPCCMSMTTSAFFIPGQGWLGCVPAAPDGGGRDLGFGHREDLAGIHDVVGIERALDRAHDFERHCTLVTRQLVTFQNPDAVLGTDRAAHL